MRIFAIIGLAFIIVSIGYAGNWIYNPLETQSILEPYQPMAEFPDGDYPNKIYSNNLTWIPSQELYYIEWNYIWLNASAHTPDTERVRIYVDENYEVHHIALSIHYEWTDVYEYEIEDTHVKLNFMPVYHTPVTSTEAYYALSANRLVPIGIPFLIGCFFLFLEYKYPKYNLINEIKRKMRIKK